MCFANPDKYFDSIQRGEDKVFFKMYQKRLNTRDERPGIRFGFTSLLYAILYDKQQYVPYLLEELCMKTLEDTPIYVNDKRINVAANSTAVHLAILLARVEIFKTIQSYIQKKNDPKLNKLLWQPNKEFLTDIHFFVLSESKEMQSVLQVKQSYIEN